MNAPVRPPLDGGNEWHPAKVNPKIVGETNLEVVYASGFRGFGQQRWHQLNEERGERVAWWRVAKNPVPALPPAPSEPEAKLNNLPFVPCPPGKGWELKSISFLSPNTPVEYQNAIPPYVVQCGSAADAEYNGAIWWREVKPAATLTGGKSDYYLVHVNVPARATSQPYTAECLDLIEALGMTFNEGEAFKALWRGAAARKGNGKPGATALYDAEKVAFYGGRMVAQAKAAP